MILKPTRSTLAATTGACLLAILLVVPSFWAFTEMKAAASARKHSYEVLSVSEALLSTLSAAETGEQGFALTGEEAFLEPYRAAPDRVPRQLAALHQLVQSPEARRHLDALGPLVDAKLANMADIVALRRSEGFAVTQAAVASGKGKRQMDAVSAELLSFTQEEQSLLAQNDAAFQSHLGSLFVLIIAAGLSTFLVALAVIYMIYKQARQRVKDQVHLETAHLLKVQEETTARLERANTTLQESEAKLAVTLDSIGDAVIATDAQARVKLMNPVAEQLTGWTLAEASGHSVDEVFRILNQETRHPAKTPIGDTLAQGSVQGVANHTLLISKGGAECAIANSCAPIRDSAGQVVGAVLVFRNVSKEYAVQQALRDKSAMIETILGTVVDGIITVRARGGLIETINPAAERMFGYQASELVGQACSMLIPSLDHDLPSGSLSSTRAISEAQVVGLGHEMEGLRKDGRRFPLEIAIGEMNLAGERFFTGILRDLSTRKQAEEVLLRDGALQSAIFNSANFSSIATDAQGVIQIFNVGAERMLGYSAANVMNKVTPADISDPQELIVRAEALSFEFGTPITPGFEALVFKASRGIEDIYELTYIREDGSRFPAVVSVTALRDAENEIIGYLLIGTDNTAGKKAEEALQRAGALQSSIFNSTNFSSIATDAQGVIQIFNVGAEEMLGYTATEVLNRITPAHFSDPQEVIARAEALSLELSTPIAPGFEALAFKASRGIEDIYELTLIRKDGSRFPAVVSVTALRDADRGVIGYLLIATDNSARMLVEAERERLDHALKEKNTELESAILVADQANLAKSEFLSSMSHELRSPLNAILGFAQLMDSASPPPLPAQKASIGRILHAGWYLLELINEILDLAVIESGRLSISEEPVLLAEIMLDCQSIIEPQGENRGIRLSFPAFSVATFVQADRVRLKQVLINLLSNAIKYNRAGGTVEVEYAAIEPGRIRISVRDSGPGLSPEKLRQLFQPFNRLGQEHGPEEGTGIGLVMSRLLVESMGGQMGVDSKVGRGSTFWFDLNSSAPPALEDGSADVSPELHQASHADGHANGRADGHARTVLCVEDNPANLELFQQLISRRPDLSLLSAGDALLGIHLATEHLPDVILMDINLPGMDGLKALGILRKGPTTSHIPVVAVSANAMVGDIQKGLDAGCFRYITKPIDIREFMQALDEALEHAKKHPARPDGKGLPL